MPLRAVVIGAGWAGEGHTIALRNAGVEVVALCGRTPDPAYAKATQLGVPEVRFDWAAALEEFRPDIVTIATPGDTHREMAQRAAALGCHDACEKPLALHADEARAMLESAKRAGVKTAYAATGRYAQAVIHAAALVAQETIGPVFQITSSVHMELPDVPYCWVHDLARGGGMLNNVFTHKLAQVVRITGGRPIAAMGTATPFRKPIPVGPTIHDFRNLFEPIEGWDASQATEWRKADADVSYTVVVQLLMPQGHIAEALFHGSASGQSPDKGQPIAIYGDGGTLAFNSDWGVAIDELQHYSRERQAWACIPIPDEIANASPQEDGVQRSWNQFFREFAADVRGEGYTGYPTFDDGRIATEVIATARAGSGWIEIDRV